MRFASSMLKWTSCLAGKGQVLLYATFMDARGLTDAANCEIRRVVMILNRQVQLGVLRAVLRPVVFFGAIGFFPSVSMSRHLPARRAWCRLGEEAGLG